MAQSLRCDLDVAQELALVERGHEDSQVDGARCSICFWRGSRRLGSGFRHLSGGSGVLFRCVKLLKIPGSFGEEEILDVIGSILAHAHDPIALVGEGVGQMILPLVIQGHHVFLDVNLDQHKGFGDFCDRLTCLVEAKGAVVGHDFQLHKVIFILGLSFLPCYFSWTRVSFSPARLVMLLASAGCSLSAWVTISGATVVNRLRNTAAWAGSSSGRCLRIISSRGFSGRPSKTCAQLRIFPRMGPVSCGSSRAASCK